MRPADLLRAYRERMAPIWQGCKDKAAKDAAAALAARDKAKAPPREPGEDDGPLDDPGEALKARARAATESYLRGAEDGTE